MRQIIALGGGGFSMEPENPLLDLYVLGQAKSTTPKVCFLPTASGDAENYILDSITPLINRIVDLHIYHYSNLQQAIWRILF